MSHHDNFWQTEKLTLRKIEPEDAQIFFEWNKHSEMPRLLDFIWPPTSLAEVQQWATELSRKKSDVNDLFLVIETAAGAVAGMIHANKVNRRTGTVGYAVAVRPKYQRQNYASEAVKLLLRYYFDELNFQKCTVSAVSNNEASIALHERLGFQQEGRLRRMAYSGGRFYDQLYFGITREEFEQLHNSEPADLQRDAAAQPRALHD